MLVAGCSKSREAKLDVPTPCASAKCDVTNGVGVWVYGDEGSVMIVEPPDEDDEEGVIKFEFEFDEDEDEDGTREWECGCG